MMWPPWFFGFSVFLLILFSHISLPIETRGASGRDHTIARVVRDARGNVVARVSPRNVVRALELRSANLDPRTAPPSRRPSRATGDPDLEPGFPVQAIHLSGTYHAGPAIHTLVGNIDDDPELEIVVTATSIGPVYAWNHDGSPVPGWPTSINGAGYPAIGDLRRLMYLVFPPNLPARRNLVVGYFGLFGSPALLAAYDSQGAYLPGWPRAVFNFVSSPPALADVDRVLLDEVFIGEEDWKLHGYRMDGSLLPGWPIFGWGGQERHTPAIADLDGDGDLEIVTASTEISPGGVYLFAYHHDGRIVNGFPAVFPRGHADTYAAVGDVDRDGHNEIVVVGRNPDSPSEARVLIFAGNGSIERVIPVVGVVPYGTAPALADLDGDRTPEIIVQSDSALNVWYGDGRRYPGWPVTWADFWMCESAPVVGDVDGDPQMEIVITLNVYGSGEFGEVRVYNADGTLHPRFPKRLKIGGGAVPAIADIDRDGRNEIVACGTYWDGYSGYYDKCWAFDLRGGPHGRIEWGQFGGNAAHHGRYPVP